VAPLSATTRLTSGWHGWRGTAPSTSSAEPTPSAPIRNPRPDAVNATAITEAGTAASDTGTRRPARPAIHGGKRSPHPWTSPSISTAPPRPAAPIRMVHAGGSLLFPAVIRSLAGAAPPADTAASRAVATFTERETATLTSMARGRSNAEIAAEQHVGVETVKTHVSSVLAKLRVRDRTQAVIAAYDAGLVRAGER
jgi:DNA-binding CsgD family transcriptional regulator